MVTLSSRPSLAVACAVVLAHGLLIAWWLTGHEPRPSQTVVTVVPLVKVQSVRLMGSVSGGNTSPALTKEVAPRARLERTAPSSTPARDQGVAPMATPSPERPVPAGAPSDNVQANAGLAITHPSGLTPLTAKGAGGGGAAATTTTLNGPVGGSHLADGPPRYLYNPKPVYPKRSRDMHEEGTVVLRVWVGAEGGVPTRVELASSSGYERLNAAALAAVTAWTFEPGRRGGQAQAMQVLVPLPFRLDAP